MSDDLYKHQRRMTFAKNRQWVIKDNVAETVINGKTVTIDTEMIPIVSRFVWMTSLCHSGSYRINTNIHIKDKKVSIGMSRLLMGFPDSIVDHINRNPLDNRISNLRIVTASQNRFNSRSQSKKSKYKGVYKSDKRINWGARICVEGKRIQIGTYKTDEEAARAYDMYALKHQGEFAFINFPESREDFLATLKKNGGK